MAAHRGFPSVEEMNSHMIDEWNAVVEPKDTVYYLGDLSFMKPVDTAILLTKLNGRIRLISGNHDHRKSIDAVVKLLAGPDPVKHADTIKFAVLDRLFTLKTVLEDVPLRLELCHFPMLTWDRAHYGVWHLHGHSHGFCRYPHPNTTMLDVGVDNVGYRPISLADVAARMAGKTFHPCDLHDPARYEGAITTI